MTGDQVVIRLTADGRIFINKDEVTAREFPAKLAEVMKGRESKVTFFAADGDLPYDKVASFMDICNENGAKNLGIVLDDIAPLERRRPPGRRPSRTGLAAARDRSPGHDRGTARAALCLASWLAVSCTDPAGRAPLMRLEGDIWAGGDELARLAAGEVHLWFVQPGAPAIPRGVERRARALSASELEQLGRRLLRVADRRLSTWRPTAAAVRPRPLPRRRARDGRDRHR